MRLSERLTVSKLNDLELHLASPCVIVVTVGRITMARAFPNWGVMEHSVETFQQMLGSVSTPSVWPKPILRLSDVGKPLLDKRSKTCPSVEGTHAWSAGNPCNDIRGVVNSS